MVRHHRRPGVPHRPRALPGVARRRGSLPPPALLHHHQLRGRRVRERWRENLQGQGHNRLWLRRGGRVVEAIQGRRQDKDLYGVMTNLKPKNQVVKAVWHDLEWFIGEILMKLGLIQRIVWDSSWRFTRYYR